ncbi:transcription termination factor Rho [Olsenella massiliensis]|uniref:transcription termination factor Rho n=1 Tax=Olsenella massiliensis TaxID=1622075 RepID=UPI0009E988E9|nr:transcription termination factor Rho [Olsenella massiliensis]
MSEEGPNEGVMPAGAIPTSPDEPARPTRARKPRTARARSSRSTTGEDQAAPEPALSATQEAQPRRRRRSRKAEQAAAQDVPSEQAQLDVRNLTEAVTQATQALGTVLDPPTMTIAEADALAVPKRRGRKKKVQQDVADAAVATGAGHAERPEETRDEKPASPTPVAPEEPGRAAPRPAAQKRRGRRPRSDEGASGASNGFDGQRNNRRNRRNRRSGQAAPNNAPSLTREELESLRVAELRSKAAELGVAYVGLKKAELVTSIYEAAARAEGFRRVRGVLEIQNEGYGFLRTGNYMPGDDDAFVHQQLIRQLGLRPGDAIEGSVGPARSSNSKYPPLQRVETVNGRAPEEMRNRPRFRDLTPIFPNERLVMEHGKDSITGRAIDLVAPIGKGQRGLIVSPPKAGKTTVLKHICQSITTNNPEVELLCLLVDERPEEVTDMERSIKGQVVASTFDMPASNHTAVSELVIEHAKRLVELGKDVAVVLDSITRLARAYNLAQPPSGRILSGGVDSAALYPPKKFLGAARNIEGGGSLTIIASALVDTGSKMDEVIFEEFKGTGNMEIKLDRDLADRRIFPAIDPVASGTRNEELLLDPQLTPFIWGIRRVLANMNNTERSASALVKGLRQTNDNQEFLIRSAKRAQQSSDYIA